MSSRCRTSCRRKSPTGCGSADRRRKAATDEALHRQRGGYQLYLKGRYLLEQTEPGRPAEGDRLLEPRCRHGSCVCAGVRGPGRQLQLDVVLQHRSPERGDAEGQSRGGKGAGDRRQSGRSAHFTGLCQLHVRLGLARSDQPLRSSPRAQSRGGDESLVLSLLSHCCRPLGGSHRASRDARWTAIRFPPPSATLWRCSLPCPGIPTMRSRNAAGRSSSIRAFAVAYDVLGDGCSRQKGCTAKPCLK